MCGIVGYIGTHRAVPIILEGLKRLEYRGYDSAGLAVYCDDDQLADPPRQGQTAQPGRSHPLNPVDGSFGIGHTRWATHGRPTEENAHPHRDCKGDIVVVHNGIVENYLALRAAAGAKATSSRPRPTPKSSRTWWRSTSRATSKQAVRAAVKELTGVFALAVISRSDPNKIVAARSGPPVVIGHRR